MHHRSINGHDVAYRMEGQGQTILLIHGIAGDSRTWGDAMKRLVVRHRVLAPDLLGYLEFITSPQRPVVQVASRLRFS